MQNIIPTLFLLSGLALSAEPTKFDFKDPKEINNVIFQMDAPLESINGSGDAISGTVYFDPENPSATKGTIVLESSSLTSATPYSRSISMVPIGWTSKNIHPSASS